VDAQVSERILTDSSVLFKEETIARCSPRRICFSWQRYPTSASVIPSEAEESGRQLYGNFPFEAGFLRYVMLRITSVGMTEYSLGSFGE
jgi:hypothetical protein